MTTTTPAAQIDVGGTYRWRVLSYDSKTGGDNGGWQGMPRCWFRVNSAPETPDQLTTEGLGCGTHADPTMVTTATPKLSSVPQDPDGGTVTARYRFYAETGDNIMEWSVQSKAELAASTRVASGLVTVDGLYRWRVITDDAFASSAWSSYCWIQVDTTAPEPPDVVQVTDDPLPGEAVEFEFVGDDDVIGFEYSLEGQAKQTVSAADGQTKVSVTPSTSAVDHALQVWAVDAAGNTSSPTTYWFTTIETQPVEAVGAWRFDGDGLDDAGSGSDVDTVAGLSYSLDNEGRADSALALDGTTSSCATTAKPILDTTDSFTVAAWARPETVAGEIYPTIFSQGGTVRPAFYLDWLQSKNRWNFTLPSADADTTDWVSAFSNDAPVVGEWQHLAAVYDAPAEPGHGRKSGVSGSW